MNILFYCTRYPEFGGTGLVTDTIGPALKTLIGGGGNALVISHLRANGEISGNLDTLYLPDEGLYDTPANRDFLQRVIDENRIDLIIYQDTYAPSYRMVVETAKRNKIKLYVFEHNAPSGPIKELAKMNFSSPYEIVRTLLTPYRQYRLKARKRYLFDNCYKYVLLSKHFYPEFKKIVRRKDYSKLTAIPNPVRFEEDTENTAKENIILFVGRMEECKRVDMQIEYWSKISKYLPEWRFIVVGDGTYRQQWEQLAKDKQLERIEFVGYQHPKSYFQRAKIFWMTSDFEGWGLTVIEAMNYGCVPVARDAYASLKEFVNNDNGYILPQNDSKGFIEASLTLATNQELWQLKSAAAKATARLYQPQNILSYWQKLLNINK